MSKIAMSLEMPESIATAAAMTTAARVLGIHVSRGGVPKRAVGAARVTSEGIEGDAWAHPRIHGGPKRALLLITAEGLDELAAQGFKVYPGALGENVTSSGLNRRAVRLGQRYRIGTVVIEITTLRVPCSTLNVYGRSIQAAIYDAVARAGDPASPRWGLSGFYASVVQPGMVCTGDAIAIVERA
jgi:MOSC domain-containing protein YiiM